MSTSKILNKIVIKIFIYFVVSVTPIIIVRLFFYKIVIVKLIIPLIFSLLFLNFLFKKINIINF